MIFDVSAEWKKRAFITPEKYQQMYKASIENPEKFWGEQAERLHWLEKWNKVKDVSFNSPVKIGWYLGGKLNVSYNCIDRNLKTRANQTAAKDVDRLESELEFFDPELKVSALPSFD